MARSLLNKNKKRVTPLEMYTNMLVRKFSANSSNIDLSVSGAAQMKFDYDKIITSNSIRKYYQLTRTAMFMPTEFVTFLRTIEEKEEYVGEGVAVNVCFKMEPHWIQWNTREMATRSMVWEQDMAEAEEQLGQNRLISEQEIEVTKQNTWLQESWKYFKEMCSEGHSTPVVQVYIELCTGIATRQAYSNLKQAGMALMQKAITNGFELREIKGNLWDFQRLFSPVSAGNPSMERKTPRFPLTDNYVADMMGYTPGKLTHTEVLMGLDIDTGKMVYKDFVSESGGAEILLIAAVTGGGKSFFAKSILFNTLLRNYTLVIMDRDGEYIPIADEMHGTVISMSRGSGKYYDSTVIAEVTGIEEVDATLLIDSQNATTAVFNILADAVNGMNSAELAMFNDAYTHLYERYEISKQNKATWYKSKNLTFHKLYAEICELKNDKYYIERYGVQLLDFIDKLRVFFDKDGVNSYLFKEPIKLDEVLDKVDGNAPLVVLHMDLSDEDGNNKQDKPTFIKLVTTNYLVNTILTHNRRLNKFTFEVVEEFQRYLNNDFAKGIVVTQVTGGRKKNANVIIITNNPDELASAVVNDKALAAIRGNITSAMIGKIQSVASIEPICQNLQLLGCEQELRDMLKRPDIYKHCFVAKFDGMEAAVIKAIVPPEYVNTNLFKTRTLKKEVNNG